MNKKWEMVKLGEVAEVLRGVTYGNSDVSNLHLEDTIPILRAGNIQDKLILDSDLVYINKKNISEKQFIKQNDIVMCMSSGSPKLVGKTAFAYSDFIGSIGAFCSIIRHSNVLPRFLYHFFNSHLFRVWTENSSGVNIKNIRHSALCNFLIPLPPLDEQKKIAQELDKLQSIIQMRKEQIEKMDLLVKAKFVEMFGDPVSNPMGWEESKIQNSLSVEPQNGLYKPSTDYRFDCLGNPILRIDAFYNGKVTSFSNLKRVTCTESEVQKYKLCEDDIVINRVNSIEYLGKCAHIKNLLEDTVFESNMMRMHFIESVISATFITHLLCTEFIYNQILSHAKKSVNQASINQKDVLDFDILIPPIELQKQFADYVQKVENIKSTMHAGLEKFELLYNSRMQEYFG